MIISVTDARGGLHLVPRERLLKLALVPVSEQERDETFSPPPGTVACLTLVHEISPSHVGQLVFYFSDPKLLATVRQDLQTWSSSDESKQLSLSAYSPPPVAATDNGASLVPNIGIGI